MEPAVVFEDLSGQQCSRCSRIAFNSLICSGCREAPVYDNEDYVPPVFYCGRACQVADWDQHQEHCMKIRPRRSLVLAGTVLEETMVLVRQQAYPLSGPPIYRADGTVSCRVPSRSTPNDAIRLYQFPKPMRREDPIVHSAIMLYGASMDAMIYLPKLVGDLLRGLYSELKEVITTSTHRKLNVDADVDEPGQAIRHTHHTYKVTLKHDKSVWALDVTAPQYGNEGFLFPWSEYIAERCDRIDGEHPLGHFRRIFDESISSPGHVEFPETAQKRLLVTALDERFTRSPGLLGIRLADIVNGTIPRPRYELLVDRFLAPIESDVKKALAASVPPVTGSSSSQQAPSTAHGSASAASASASASTSAPTSSAPTSAPPPAASTTASASASAYASASGPASGPAADNTPPPVVYGPVRPPPPKLYRIATVPGKGLGFIATARIPRGTRIQSEAPIFKVKRDAPNLDAVVEMIDEVVNRLSEEQSTRFFALHSAFGDGLSASLAVAMTNVLPLGSTPEEAGLFLEAARINHSCKPNAQASWHATIGENVIHAFRDIKREEEITISYLDRSEGFAKRQDRLVDAYAFECACEVCSLPPEQRKESDERLAKITALNKRLTDSTRIISSPRESLLDAHEVLRLLREEDILDVRLPELYYNAFQVAIANGDEARARAFAQRAIAEYVVLEGADGPNTKIMKEFAETPATHGLYGMSMAWQQPAPWIPRDLNPEEFEAWLWMK